MPTAWQLTCSHRLMRRMRGRVAGWRAKILPLIEDQDARDPFDIHVCGDCILARLARLSIGGGDQPLLITAATEQANVHYGGGSAALAVAAREPEQLPTPPVGLESALAEDEQWQISRHAQPELTIVNVLHSAGGPL